MRTSNLFVLILINMAILASTGMAEVITFIDEAAYLAELAARGYAPLTEDFEDADWDRVRSDYPMTNAAVSVSSKGLTWTGNEPISTNQNWGRFGTWGIFTIYVPPTPTLDELFVDSEIPLFGAGGWLDVNSSGDMAIEINGEVMVDRPIVGGHQFLGVIFTCGFRSLRIVDLEAHSVWGADDFTFAVGGTFQDCNDNGLDDACDLVDSTSSDCNDTGVPDECEIATGESSDCNANGVPDECELLDALAFASGQLSPIGDGSPQEFVITAPPESLADVSMDFSAYAQLSGPTRFVDVDLNGVPIGTIFGQDGTNCPEAAPNQALLTVPQAIFNDTVGGGDAVVHMSPSADVVAEGECDFPTYIGVMVTLSVPAPADGDGSGVLDVCEHAGDFNGDGFVDLADFAAMHECLTGPGAANTSLECTTSEFSVADVDGDGDVDLEDFGQWQVLLYNGLRADSRY